MQYLYVRCTCLSSSCHMAFGLKTVICNMKIFICNMKIFVCNMKIFICNIIIFICTMYVPLELLARGIWAKSRERKNDTHTRDSQDVIFV